MVKKIKQSIRKVAPNKIYNVAEMRRDDILPWLSAKNPQVYVNTIMDDFLGKNILKTKISGVGRGRDYKITGKNIIKYLTKKSQEHENIKH